MSHQQYIQSAELDNQIDVLFNSLTHCYLTPEQIMQARLSLLEKFSLSQDITKTLCTCKKEDLKHLKECWVQNEYIIHTLQRKMNNYGEIKKAIDKNFSVNLITDDLLKAHQNTKKAIQEIEKAQKNHSPKIVEHAKKIAVYANYQKYFIKTKIQQAKGSFSEPSKDSVGDTIARLKKT